MLAAVLECIGFILAIASISLLAGLLRTAKTASQVTEEPHLADVGFAVDDEQSTLQEQLKSQSALRTAS